MDLPVSQQLVEAIIKSAIVAGRQINHQPGAIPGDAVRQRHLAFDVRFCNQARPVRNLCPQFRVLDQAGFSGRDQRR